MNDIPNLEQAKQACHVLNQFFINLASGTFFVAGELIIPVTVSNHDVPAEEL